MERTTAWSILYFVRNDISRHCTKDRNAGKIISIVYLFGALVVFGEHKADVLKLANLIMINNGKKYATTGLKKPHI